MVSNQSEWDKVVWSNEKKCTFNEPDGFAYKWHDLRKLKVWFSERQKKVTVSWFLGDFAGLLKSSSVFLVRKQNGEEYIRTMEDPLQFFSEDLPLTKSFMHDDAPCHLSIVAQNGFLENAIQCFDYHTYFT